MPPATGCECRLREQPTRKQEELVLPKRRRVCMTRMRHISDFQPGVRENILHQSKRNTGTA
jgi:hypothetical protein